MSITEYQARFLTLLRFEPGSISNEFEQTAQFVVGLRIYIRFVVATIAYRTLAQAIMKALECEHAYESRQ